VRRHVSEDPPWRAPLFYIEICGLGQVQEGVQQDRAGILESMWTIKRRYAEEEFGQNQKTPEQLLFLIFQGVIIAEEGYFHCPKSF
jgi:hypothetical protein